MGAEHVGEQITLPLTYSNVFIPIFSVRSAVCSTQFAEGSPRCRIDDLSHVYFYSGMSINREGFFWLTIGI